MAKILCLRPFLFFNILILIKDTDLDMAQFLLMSVVNNSYIALLDFVKLSILLNEKGRRKRYAMPTALVVV